MCVLLLHVFFANLFHPNNKTRRSWSREQQQTKRGCVYFISNPTEAEVRIGTEWNVMLSVTDNNWKVRNGLLKQWKALEWRVGVMLPELIRGLTSLSICLDTHCTAMSLLDLLINLVTRHTADSLSWVD